MPRPGRSRRPCGDRRDGAWSPALWPEDGAIIRERIDEELAEALRRGDAQRANILRLMRAALRDREAARAEDDTPGRLSEAEVYDLLQRMLRQREKSIATYEQGARMELAEQERREISIIREFLPRTLTEGEVNAEIDRAIRETGARSIRDLGRVMALLKRRYPGRIDFARAGARVKAALD